MIMTVNLYESYQIWGLIGALIVLAVISAFHRMIVSRRRRE